jgi:hypothetical protein
MTDPKDTDTTKATDDGELRSDVLDAVTGGEARNYTWNYTT